MLPAAQSRCTSIPCCCFSRSSSRCNFATSSSGVDRRLIGSSWSSSDTKDRGLTSPSQDLFRSEQDTKDSERVKGCASLICGVLATLTSARSGCGLLVRGVAMLTVTQGSPSGAAWLSISETLSCFFLGLLVYQ